MGKEKSKRKKLHTPLKHQIRVTPTQKRKAKRVALSSVVTAVLVTFFFLLQLATIKISNSDFPTGNIIPQQDVGTKGWTTYADNRFGFSFEYPSDTFSVVDDSENNYVILPTGYPEVIEDAQNDFFTSKGYVSPRSLYAIKVQNQDSTLTAPTFSLWIFDNANMLSAGAWYEKYDYYPFAFAPYIPAPVNAEQPIQNVLISDTLGKYHLRFNQSNGEVAYVYIAKGQTMFLIALDVTADDNVGNKILSTLRLFSNTNTPVK